MHCLASRGSDDNNINFEKTSKFYGNGDSEGTGGEDTIQNADLKDDLLIWLRVMITEIVI
jgi:hypothetical protein